MSKITLPIILVFFYTLGCSTIPANETHENQTAKKSEHTLPVSTKHASASHHGHDNSAGVTAEVALGWLKNGNTRYLEGSLRKDGQKMSDVKRLSTGQKPHTIILSCSDSRVPPEILFDQKLGEVFVIRTAGQALDGNVIGSVEYALEHLGAKHILVMGHTSCGAVTAAMNTLDGSSAGSPSLDKLVGDIHPRITSFKGAQPTKGLVIESWANVKGVSHDLVLRSKIISDFVKSHHIKINEALYHLDSGKVEFEKDFKK